MCESSSSEGPSPRPGSRATRLARSGTRAYSSQTTPFASRYSRRSSAAAVSLPGGFVVSTRMSRQSRSVTSSRRLDVRSLRNGGRRVRVRARARVGADRAGDLGAQKLFVLRTGAPARPGRARRPSWRQALPTPADRPRRGPGVRLARAPAAPGRPCRGRVAFLALLGVRCAAVVRAESVAAGARPAPRGCRRADSGRVAAQDACRPTRSG